jgi:hypothetical protein
MQISTTAKHNDYPNAGITCFLCCQMFKDNRYLDEHNKRYHKPSKYFEVREKKLLYVIGIYMIQKT